MSNSLKYTGMDKFCLGLDSFLKTLIPVPCTQSRPSPANAVPNNYLTPAELNHSAALMRINHTGEKCAQALYQAQGLVSRSKDLKNKMTLSALEEMDHLHWCKNRLVELQSHPSYLNPLWVGGSFMIGLAAGLAGDPWSLGFIAETEKQVVSHLARHLVSLPKNDVKSYTILEQMQKEEFHHQQEALEGGAKRLPKPITYLMNIVSKIMVKTTYWI